MPGEAYGQAATLSQAGSGRKMLMTDIWRGRFDICNCDLEEATDAPLSAVREWTFAGYGIGVREGVVHRTPIW
jgi:hypothetical protein